MHAIKVEYFMNLFSNFNTHKITIYTNTVHYKIKLAQSEG